MNIFSRVEKNSRHCSIRASSHRWSELNYAGGGIGYSVPRSDDEKAVWTWIMLCFKNVFHNFFNECIICRINYYHLKKVVDEERRNELNPRSLMKRNRKNWDCCRSLNIEVWNISQVLTVRPCNSIGKQALTGLRCWLARLACDQ